MFKHQASYLLICSICRAVYLCSYILNFFFDICLQLAGLVVEYHLGRCCLGLGETGVGCSRLEVSYGHSLMIYKVLEGPTLACTSSRMSSHHHSYLLLSFLYDFLGMCFLSNAVLLDTDTGVKYQSIGEYLTLGYVVFRKM